MAFLLNELTALFAMSGAPVSGFALVACTLASLAMGLVIALTYMFRNSYTKSFVATLVLLPAFVSLVIAVVNGNLGAGVAVMGAFSLVRFRSIPGTAREISSIFFAMAVGLAAGMGYLGAAFIFLAVAGAASVLLTLSAFGDGTQGEKELRVTIPENLDYSTLFEDLFQKYTKKSELRRVKTTNMGSLYELLYAVELRDGAEEKAFLDEIRCRNGNLNIQCGLPAARRDEL